MKGIITLTVGENTKVTKLMFEAFLLPYLMNMNLIYIPHHSIFISRENSFM